MVVGAKVCELTEDLPIKLLVKWEDYIIRGYILLKGSLWINSVYWLRDN